MTPPSLRRSPQGGAAGGPGKPDPRAALAALFLRCPSASWKLAWRVRGAARAVARTRTNQQRGRESLNAGPVESRCAHRRRRPDRVDARESTRAARRAPARRRPQPRPVDPHQGARRAGTHARNLLATRHRRASARARHARDRREPVGRRAPRRAHPVRRHRAWAEPVPFPADPRAGRQRATARRRAARARHRRVVEHRARRPGAERGARTRNARARRRLDAGDRGELDRGLRRAAQHGAQPEPDRFPGRTVRARVLRRRYAHGRADGAGRAQPLSLARRLPHFLPDARGRSLARGRHRAARAACPRRSGVRRGASRRSQRGGTCAFAAGVHLVLHLPHPPSARRALPRRAAASCSAMLRTSTARSVRRA